MLAEWLQRRSVVQTVATADKLQCKLGSQRRDWKRREVRQMVRTPPGVLAMSESLLLRAQPQGKPYGHEHNNNHVLLSTFIFII